MLMKSPTMTPSLHNLAYILRRPSLWPEGFRWDYRWINHCAIGISEQLWGDRPSEFGLMSEWREGIMFCCGQDHVRLFGWRIPFTGVFKSVTPEMVADRIDEYTRCSSR